MKIVSGVDMRRMERWAMEQRHIPEILLMENAGRAVAQHAWQYLTKQRNQVVVVCGKGNNGGDALVAARHLQQWGSDVRLFLLDDPENFKGAARENWGFIEVSGIRWYRLNDQNSFYPLKLCLETANVAIDGIFGTGFKGQLTDVYLQAVQVMNQGSALILAIDIPSGVDGDTGQKANEAIRAHKTVTLGYAKQGLYLYPGRELAGEVVVEDISLPKDAVDILENPTQWNDRDEVRRLLPPVIADCYKGSFGHVLAMAGSRGMMGAALLATRAVLRSGAGVVTTAVPDSLAAGFDLALAEGMTLGLAEDGQGGLDLAAAEQILQALSGKAVFLAGPGLQRQENLPLILEQILSNTEVPAVLDAGALWSITQNPDICRNAKGPLILTPHPGELAALLDLTTAQIQTDRCAFARQAAKDFNAVVILKGAGTVIADPAGTLLINSTGNAALAAAGSGDVLAGAVAAWVAQGLKPLDAAAVAVYLHGAAGDRLSQEVGLRGGLAGEVAELLPYMRQEMLTD